MNNVNRYLETADITAQLDAIKDVGLLMVAVGGFLFAAYIITKVVATARWKARRDDMSTPEAVEDREARDYLKGLVGAGYLTEDMGIYLYYKERYSSLEWE